MSNKKSKKSEVQLPPPIGATRCNCHLLLQLGAPPIGATANSYWLQIIHYLLCFLIHILGARGLNNNNDSLTLFISLYPSDISESCRNHGKFSEHVPGPSRFQDVTVYTLTAGTQFLRSPDQVKMCPGSSSRHISLR